MALKHNLTLRELRRDDLEELMNLQEAVFNLDSRADDWLRRNSLEDFGTLVEASEHITIGHFEGASIASFGALQSPREGEAIRGYLSDHDGVGSLNLKVVFASTAHRRSGLGRAITEELSLRGLLLGATSICCTIHPENYKSRGLFQSIGYELIGTALTSYGGREIWELRG
jgi:RimJ/RimL family protein N-acetyltransferase